MASGIPPRANHRRRVRPNAKRPSAPHRRSGLYRRIVWSAALALGVALAFAIVADRPAQGSDGTMHALSGTYTGNGTSQSITGLGFQPDIVIIKGDLAEVTVMSTSSMGSDATKPLVGSAALATGLITSLDADGFTVGSDASVNDNSVVYHWIAFEEAAGQLKVGSYPGNDGTQSIEDVGFQPDYVIVMSAGAKAAVHQSSTMPFLSYFLSAEGGGANRITAFDAEGFDLGDSSKVNTTAFSPYYYVAWKEVASLMDVGTYSGDGSDNRSITGVGFRPEWVIVVQETEAAQHKPDSSGATTDISLDFRPSTNDTDDIQALEADGFQVGTGTQVNESGMTFHWMAFVLSVPPPAVTGLSPTSGPAAGGTSVTITGTNLTGATAVSFGGTAASGFTVDSATQITATAPAHAVGAADVLVTTSGGTSANTAGDDFTYLAATITLADASQTSATIGATTQWTITFALPAVVASGNDVTIDFPAGFDATVADLTLDSFANTTNGEMQADIALSQGGDTTIVVFTNNGGGSIAAEALTVKLSGVTNPTTAGDPGAAWGVSANGGSASVTGASASSDAIAQKALTVNGITADTKSYDGNKLGDASGWRLPGGRPRCSQRHSVGHSSGYLRVGERGQRDSGDRHRAVDHRERRRSELHADGADADGGNHSEGADGERHHCRHQGLTTAPTRRRCRVAARWSASSRKKASPCRAHLRARSRRRTWAVG